MTKHLFTETVQQRRHFLCLNVLKLSVGARVVINHDSRAPCLKILRQPLDVATEWVTVTIIWCPVVWYFNYPGPCYHPLSPHASLPGAYKGVGVSIKIGGKAESVWLVTEHGAPWQGSVLTWRMPSLPCHERTTRVRWHDEMTRWWLSDIPLASEL
mgnify:CR=1 FL=1